MTIAHLVGLILLLFSALILIFYIFFSKWPFVNVREIIQNYWRLFDSSPIHRFIFFVIPCLIGIGLALLFPINYEIVETVCTAVSILLGLLFAALGALMGIYETTKSSPTNLTQKKVFNETMSAVLYVSVLAVATLSLSFFSIIASNSLNLFKSYIPILRFIGGVSIYSFLFSILLNCLIVFKRVSRLIYFRT